MTISIHDNHETMYLTADEAAKALGVSRATLYAYVSRRGIRSIPVAGTRERLYWKSDIERTKTVRGRPVVQRAAVAPPESSVSLIGPETLYYRGIDAVSLSESSSIEQIAALLWDQPETELFTTRLPVFPEAVRQILKIMASSSGVARAVAALPLIEESNPKSFDFSPRGMATTGADVLRSLTALMLGRNRPSAAPVHEQIGAHFGLSGPWQDCVRRMLVLSADHGFEPSSFAVRSVASIGVSPYRSVAAGLLLASGRRTQLGRTDTVRRLISEVCDGDPEAAIVARVRDGDQVPGFGSHLYVNGDPRAHALLAQLGIVMGDALALARLRRAIAVVRDVLDLHPDFALIQQFAVSQFQTDQSASVFALGRSVGWIAHSIEQYRTGEAIRPASIYTGPLPEEAR